MDDNARFYLTFEPWPVPADGLYVYEKRSADGRQLACWRIGGKNEEDEGRPTNETQLVLTHPPQPLEGGARYLVPINGLLFETRVPGSQEPVFISLERIDTRHEVKVYRVRPLSMEQGQGVVAYEFPGEVRRNLWWLSKVRHETIYRKLAEEFQSADPAEPKRYNATPAWRSLNRVSQAMVAHLTRSLAHSERTSSYDNANLFSNPDWVFQLHRVLVEGCAEGHESVIGIPLDYDTDPKSTPAWKAALQEAAEGHTWDDYHEELKEHAPEVYEAILNIAFWYKFGWADELLDWIVPGKTEAQEYCFLRMHYAHWYCDLLWALKKYGEGRRYGDWPIICDLVMDNCVSPSEGPDQYILSLLIRLADTMAGGPGSHADDFRASTAEVADWVTRTKNMVVNRVFDDLRKRATRA